MTLLDDARAILDRGRPINDGMCDVCKSFDGHNPGCAWLSLPRIVAVIGAAQSVIERSPATLCMQGGGGRRRCRYCSYRVWVGDDPATVNTGGKHDDDCPWQVLAVALKEGGA